MTEGDASGTSEALEEVSVKTVTLLRRRRDLSSSQFHQYWRYVHAPLVWRLAGVVRYAQSRIQPWDGESDTYYDGIAEVWYSDAKAMRKAFESEEYRQLLADEPNFMAAATKDLIFVAAVEDDIPNSGSFESDPACEGDAGEGSGVDR